MTKVLSQKEVLHWAALLKDVARYPGQLRIFRDHEAFICHITEQI